MRIRAKRSNRRRHRGLRVGLVVIASVTAILLLADMTIRPAVEELVMYQAKVFATRLINAAMVEQLESESFEYERFVDITRDENGEIKSIEADMSQINRLKSKVSSGVSQKLDDPANRALSMPIGTIIGNELTSGRGPLVEIRMVPAGYVQTEIYNRFTAAGINQTLHQIMLGVTVQMTAVLPGYRIRTETQTSFCIAETVIVGQIPQGYAVIGETPALFAPVGDG